MREDRELAFPIDSFITDRPGWPMGSCAGDGARDPLDAEQGRAVTTPIKTEPWGERYFQVTDPNGVVIQLAQWITTVDVR